MARLITRAHFNGLFKGLIIKGGLFRWLIKRAYYRGLFTGLGLITWQGLIRGAHFKGLFKGLITGAYYRAGSYYEDVSGWEGGCGKAYYRAGAY